MNVDQLKFMELLKSPDFLRQVSEVIGQAQASTRGQPPKVKPIEDKAYRRVDKFSGEGSWNEWSFNVITATNAINSDVGKVMQNIIEKGDLPLSDETIKGFVPEDIEVYHKTELFNVLTGLTTGEANSVVRGSINKTARGHDGFCALYALNARFNPKTPARALQFFFTVVNPPAIKDVRFIPKAIEDWEARKAKLFSEFGEKMSPTLEAAILTAMLPQEFQNIIFQSQGTDKVNYEISVTRCYPLRVVESRHLSRFPWISEQLMGTLIPATTGEKPTRALILTNGR